MKGAIKTGMPKPPSRTRLQKLQKHWRRASEDERMAFLAEIGTAYGRDRGSLTDSTGSPPADWIANGRYLLPETVRRLETIMKARRIGPDEVAAEFGYADQGFALARALLQKGSLRLAVIAALARWLAAQDLPKAGND